MFSAQIDYVIDAINAVPQEMLDDQRVRIATGSAGACFERVLLATGCTGAVGAGASVGAGSGTGAAG